MKIIHKILVPVDFSEIAANSYRYALQLAGELSASIHLLHCLPAMPVMPSYGHVVLDMTPQLNQQANERLNAFAEEGKTAVHGQLSRIPEVQTSFPRAAYGFILFAFLKAVL